MYKVYSTLGTWVTCNKTNDKCVAGESNTSGSGSGSNTWSTEDTRREAAGMTSSDARTTWCKVVTRRNHHNSCMRHSTASLPSMRHQLHQSTHRASRPGQLSRAVSCSVIQNNLVCRLHILGKRVFW